MSRTARFKVRVSVENRPNIATVTIDRGAMTFSVRMHRRRRVDVLPLAAVAELVWWRFTKAIVREKAENRKRRRI